MRKKLKLIKDKKDKKDKSNKADKSALIFYKLAKKISPKILDCEKLKFLMRYTKGIEDEHLCIEKFILTVSKTIFNFASAILLSIVFVFLLDENPKIIALSIISIIAISLSPFAKVRREYKKNESDLDIGIENLVNELSILVSSGMSLDSAMKLKRTDRKTYAVMNMFYKYLENSKKKGLNINASILGFSKIYRNKYLNKLNVLISQSKKKGTGKQAEALIALAGEIMGNRKMNVKKKAETLSTKMLMPLMVSMIGIIIMIMVPVFMQLAM